MKRYRIEPGSRVDLSAIDPDDKSAFSGGKDEASVEQAALRARLERLQELLYAEHQHKVLIVLQAMDAGGKDGTIRAVFEGVNPQGVSVVSFKVPSAEELDHDYLWRVHRHVPGKGQMVIFNRSHYEDVLIARVRDLVRP
ncbi:MAG: polyphosphate kinase 2 family protein, partial [Chloroflexi bacterium]|nr:polyphosphate kinase 2 family protein [Chloroflexota bacterium]